MQSMEVSLSGGGFSVGGSVAAVTLQSSPMTVSQAFEPEIAGSRLSFLADDLSGGSSLDAPEPHSGALLALGCALLSLMGLVLKRRRKAAPLQ
jgi:hypothetical protein